LAGKVERVSHRLDLHDEVTYIDAPSWPLTGTVRHPTDPDDRTVIIEFARLPCVRRIREVIV
jgi:hypothetical protein